MKKTLLPIGDIHIEPGQSLDRLHLLGRFILEKQPDSIIIMGDFCSFNSLTPHELGTIHSEGQRFQRDIDACNKGLAILHSYIDQLPYTPQLYFLWGNHEYWITRYVERHPEMEGVITLEKVKFKPYGWKIIPFLEPLILQGFSFQHYFTSGTMGRPIGGEHQASRLVKTGLVSCVVGHSHTFAYWETLNVLGKKQMGLNVGCFLEKKAHYTHEQKRWWSGLVLIREAQYGYGSIAKYDLSYLKKRFGPRRKKL